MELVNDLGAKIEKLWREKIYNETLFPAIAAQATKKRGTRCKPITE